MSVEKDLAGALAIVSKYSERLYWLEELEQSLRISMIAAGGSSAMLNRDKLQNMTALELLLLIAPNGIRFYHVR